MSFGILVLVVVGVVTTALNLSMKKRGYAIGTKAAARCSKGHVFRTVWIEGVSMTAVRLGPTTRYQRCPTCGRFRLVHLVKEVALSPEDRLSMGESGV